MSNDNKNLGKLSMDQLSKILDGVRALAEVARALVLNRELQDLSDEMDALTYPDEDLDKPKATSANIPAKSGVSLSEAIDNLKEFTTTRSAKNGVEFLLHRLTDDFEYEKSAKDEHTYQTEASTDWVAEHATADDAQDEGELEQGRKGANPVVSCWIPRAAIEAIPNPHANNGTWEDLGKNPQGSKYIIRVKPGKYEIYAELKQ